MAGDWSEVPLGDVITLQRGFDLPAQDRKPGKVPIVSSSGISDFHSEVGVKGPGVVTGRYGTIGQVFFIKEDYWPLNTTLWVKDFHGNDPKFASYLLRTVDFRSCSDKTSVPGVNRNDLHRIPVLLPPLAEQEAIAVVLGGFDDKIELNRRMNTTLRAMARALFHSWFVDFDPVRAKHDDSKPMGLDKATAALFPVKFQDSTLGPIPQGWGAGVLGKIISAARERVGKSDAVVLSAVSSSELVRSDDHFNKKVYSKSISNYLKVKRWDFAYNPSRINIGSIGMLKEEIVGAVSPVYEVFRPTDSYQWFVEQALAEPDIKVWIQTLCSGSVRQSLKLKDLESIPLVIPPLPIVQEFNKAWDQWHGLIRGNERQSRTLAILRDTLLPKLMSGEIGVDSFSMTT